MEVGLWLGKNVTSDFRYRKIILYIKTIIGMKTISMNTIVLKQTIENEVK